MSPSPPTIFGGGGGPARRDMIAQRREGRCKSLKGRAPREVAPRLHLLSDSRTLRERFRHRLPDLLLLGAPPEERLQALEPVEGRPGLQRQQAYPKTRCNRASL